jgi:hypothetical protein
MLLFLFSRASLRKLARGYLPPPPLQMRGFDKGGIDRQTRCFSHVQCPCWLSKYSDTHLISKLSQSVVNAFFFLGFSNSSLLLELPTIITFTKRCALQICHQFVRGPNSHMYVYSGPSQQWRVANIGRLWTLLTILHQSRKLNTSSVCVGPSPRCDGGSTWCWSLV